MVRVRRAGAQRKKTPLGSNLDSCLARAEVGSLVSPDAVREDCLAGALADDVLLMTVCRHGSPSAPPGNDAASCWTPVATSSSHSLISNTADPATNSRTLQCELVGSSLEAQVVVDESLESYVGAVGLDQDPAEKAEAENR